MLVIILDVCNPRDDCALNKELDIIICFDDVILCADDGDDVANGELEIRDITANIVVLFSEM